MAEQNIERPQQKKVDEIDIMEYVSKLWKNRRQIVKWCCIGAVIGLVVGFSLPKTYKAFTTLEPTPCNPADTLYPFSLENLPPACKTV